MTTLEFTLEEAQMALYSEEDSKRDFDNGITKMHFEIVRFIEEGDGMGAAIVMRHHLNAPLKYLK